MKTLIELLNFLHTNQLFFILHAFLVIRVFKFFHVAVSEIIC